MKLSRSWRAVSAAALVAPLVFTACSRRKSAEVNPIVPSIQIHRTRAPLGSAVEITYTWTVEPGAKRLPQDYRALVHFLDSHEVMLFDDDHMPVPSPSTWEPGKTYSYTRTKFIPIYPYVGDVEVRMGLYPHPGRGDRPVLKGEHRGFHEYRVGKMELLPQTENVFLIWKDGWHNPEPMPENPGIERTWSKKEGLVSFRNPRKDVIIYVEADTCVKCFAQQPVLTVSVNDKVGLVVPIEDGMVFLKKIRVKAADLGTEEWVDLKLAMNQSFVPKLLTPPLNNDDRELGLLVYHLYVGEADQLGSPEGVVDASALPVAVPVAARAKAPRKP